MGLLRGAARLASGLATKSKPIAGGRARMNIDQMLDLGDQPTLRDAAFGPRNVSWEWTGRGWKKSMDEVGGVKGVARAMSDAETAFERELLHSFPRQYEFSGLTKGHTRAYRRRLADKIAGSGYRLEQDGDNFILTPTAEAYLRWARKPAAGGLLAAAAASDWGGE